jgi:hypothetical protein
LHQAQTPPAFLGQDREAAYVAEIQQYYVLMATPAAPDTFLLLRKIRKTKMALRFFLDRVVIIVGFTGGTTPTTAHNVVS